MGLITKAKGAPKSADGRSGGGGGVKFICNVCSNDITSTVRIRCASKQCPDYDLCVPCFAQGNCNLHHDPRTHPYQVIEPHSIPIFEQGWGADEELLLLEGAEQYGLGSWADIADHIGGFREKDEVRDHYINTYVNSTRFPLPERASPQDTTLSDSIPREEFQARKKRRIESRKEAISDAAATAPTPAKPTSSIPSCHEVAGYMPGRLEFENEYFNEAEEAVQHMQFAPEEGLNTQTKAFEPETELKMVVMDIYNDRLTNRIDRKRVIFSHRLLEYRRNLAIDKKRTKDQRDLQQKLKPFARIMSHPDYASYASDLETEQNLRQAITQLQEWRRHRIPSLSLGEKFEAEKAARLARTTQALGAFDRMSNGVRPNNKTPAPPETAAAVAEYTTSTSIPIRLNTGPADPSDPTVTTSADAATQPLATAGTVSETPKRTPLAPIPNITPLPASTVASHTDTQLLLPTELELCSKLRLHPKAYSAIKLRVLQEALKNEGRLKKKDVRGICGIDTTRGGRLFEFWVEGGWVGNGAGK